MAGEARRPGRNRAVPPPYAGLRARGLGRPRCVGARAGPCVLPERAVRQVQPHLSADCCWSWGHDGGNAARLSAYVRAVAERPRVDPSPRAVLTVRLRRRHRAVGGAAQRAQRLAKRSAPDVRVTRHTILEPAVIAAPAVREPKVGVLPSAGKPQHRQCERRNPTRNDATSRLCSPDEELCDVEEEGRRLRCRPCLN